MDPAVAIAAIVGALGVLAALAVAGVVVWRYHDSRRQIP